MKPRCVCDWDLTVIDVDARRFLDEPSGHGGEEVGSV